MNYEQKHQKDLEAAEGWLAIAKENNNTIAIQILEKFFPELKESEDEKIYQSIIDDTVQENQLDGNQIAWLKSIKPNHWKPSEEQMNELRKIAFQFGNSSLSPYSDENKELVSLYNDLKKL